MRVVYCNVGSGCSTVTSQSLMEHVSKGMDAGSPRSPVKVGCTFTRQYRYYFQTLKYCRVPPKPVLIQKHVELWKPCENAGGVGTSNVVLGSVEATRY